MTKRIIVTLAMDGTISAESAGVPGPACMDDVTLIQALVPHASIVGSNLTSGYYETISVDNDDLNQSTLSEQDRA
jgi:hypothetical protein